LLIYALNFAGELRNLLFIHPCATQIWEVPSLTRRASCSLPVLSGDSALVGSSGANPQLHQVPRDEPLDLQYHPRRVRHL